MRDFAKTPFIWENKTVATDGIIIIYTAHDRECYPQADYKKYPISGIKECFDVINSQNLAFRPLEHQPVIGHFCKKCNGFGRLITTTCQECNGDGYLDFKSDFHNYSVECKTCEGAGTINMDNPLCDECGGYGCVYPDIEIDGVFIGYPYLQKLQTIKGCEVAGIKDKCKLVFKNTLGVCGLVMGVYSDN